jgi:glycosyltransferase involved in cell wall biosynthesis
MRILIVTFYFPPLATIASYRPYSWAKCWSDLGHDVTVLTTDKSQYGDAEGGDRNFRIVETDPGCVFAAWERMRRICCSEPPSAVSAAAAVGTQDVGKQSALGKAAGRINAFLVGKGVLVGSRMPDLTDGWIRPALRWLKDNGPWDVTVSTYGPYTTHYIAMRARMKKATRFWAADFRDLWTDNHAFPGLFPFTLLEGFLERYAMRKADLITTVSDPLAHVLAGKYGDDKVNVVENGFDLSDIGRLEEAPVFPRDGKVRIVYTGTIYAGRQNAEPLLGAVSDLAKDPAKQPLLQQLEVLFCGKTMADLDEQIRRYDVSEWVKYIGLVSREEALRMQRDAHILLFLEWNDREVDGILTGKLFEYAASGTSVWSIGERETAASMLIGQLGAGAYLGADRARIREALVRLLEEKRKPPGGVDRERLAAFERGRLARHFLHLIEERIGREDAA